ncbi:conserved hypothetical protein [Ricinus communis]|uniref:Uncharacterized protein n=1 Tax=Ricinus communis TaxID=3988 RepID=B9RPI4_RICCO|nr:conserved hypothetical protein [Ricinus communis]
MVPARRGRRWRQVRGTAVVGEGRIERRRRGRRDERVWEERREKREREGREVVI